jgi:hypothetical protein
MRGEIGRKGEREKRRKMGELAISSVKPNIISERTK